VQTFITAGGGTRGRPAKALLQRGEGLRQGLRRQHRQHGQVLRRPACVREASDSGGSSAVGDLYYSDCNERPAGLIEYSICTQFDDDDDDDDRLLDVVTNCLVSACRVVRPTRRHFSAITRYRRHDMSQSLWRTCCFLAASRLATRQFLNASTA